MIYIDTSAVLKLVHPEAESGALRMWLANHPDDLVADLHAVGVAEHERCQGAGARVDA